MYLHIYQYPIKRTYLNLNGTSFSVVDFLHIFYECSPFEDSISTTTLHSYILHFLNAKFLV